jgi:hypothetical protein
MEIQNWQFGDILKSKRTGIEFALTEEFLNGIARKTAEAGLSQEQSERLTMEQLVKLFVWVRRPAEQAK